MSELNVSFIFGTQNKCYFETPARYLRFASMYVDSLQIEVPIVLVAYELPQLQILTKFFAEMDRKEAKPEVYVWDTHLPEPEMLVRFAVDSPKKNIVEEIAGPRYRSVTDTFDHWHYLATAAAANMDKEHLEQFLQKYEAVRYAGVTIIEASNDDSFMVRDPVHAFVTQAVHQKEPPVILD